MTQHFHDPELIRRWQELEERERSVTRREQDVTIRETIISSIQQQHSGGSPTISRNVSTPTSPPMRSSNNHTNHNTMTGSKKGVKLAPLTKDSSPNRPNENATSTSNFINAPMFPTSLFNGGASVSSSTSSSMKIDGEEYEDRREIKEAFLKSLNDQQIAAALSAFNSVDKNRDGTIDSFELYDALKILYGDISLPEANAFYSDIDSNRSGKITFDEWLHATIQYQWDTSRFLKKEKPQRSIDLRYEWEIPYEELVFEAKLGEGTYGVVYKGKWRHTTVAIKELKLSEMKDKLLADFRNEISIMGRLRHPNVILYMGACTKEPHFCIVTELLPGGSIYDVLHSRKARFDVKLALYFAKQTALALNYLHLSAPQVVHRDLKSENLLLDNHLNVKVCDFGLSCVKPQTEILKEQVGSPLWMAPEVLIGGTYDERCDVYSYALILWEFFANALPYSQCEEFRELVEMVVHKGVRPPMPPHTPPDIAKLIRACWDPDPKQRPNFAQIIETIQEITRNTKDKDR